MVNKEKIWVKTRELIAEILVPLFLLPFIWRYLYVLKDEITDTPHWFRIDFFGGWQEDVGNIFNTVAQGDYLKDGIYPIIIPILIMIGIITINLTFITISLTEGKLAKPSSNFQLRRRITNGFLIVGASIGLSGLILFTKFVNSIREVKLMDYSVTFYVQAIIFTISLLIGILSMIHPGNWNKYSEEETIEDDFDDPWKKPKSNNIESVE
ncbi:MAG: hypothetical protein ACTSO7_07890 [Candidatus Heimdallarchaeota archaeon]